MQTLRVGGRRYSDPDVVSLIRATGELVDPRAAVLTQARRLNAELENLGGTGIEPIERLKILASLRGLEVEHMSRERRKIEVRDAILIPRNDGKDGLIAYNPDRPQGRVAFSIAHEIAHTFFPNSTSGARFRSLCNSDSREANELERLCDLGASELLMPHGQFRRALGNEFGLNAIPRLCEQFGSSYEATVFRLATTHEGICIAGLLRYRYRASEERALLSRGAQQFLFDRGESSEDEMPVLPKYRRQSLHMSEKCGDEHIVRWNKSFESDSCVYAAGLGSEIGSGRETLPNEAQEFGTIEAIRAPFQREEADPIFADVLFVWWKQA